jgi:hypothetical protein
VAERIFLSPGECIVNVKINISDILSPGIKNPGLFLSKHPCSSIGRMSVSKTEDEGSSPYMGAKMPP